MSSFTDGMSILCQAATTKPARQGLVDVAWWAASAPYAFYESWTRLGKNSQTKSINSFAIKCRCRAIVAHDRVMNLVENGERR